MLVKEFMEYMQAVNDSKVNSAFKEGYVALACQYLADIFEQKAHEAYAKRVCRPWHTDHPSEEIEKKYWEISLKLRQAC